MWFRPAPTKLRRRNSSHNRETCALLERVKLFPQPEALLRRPFWASVSGGSAPSLLARPDVMLRRAAWQPCQPSERVGPLASSSSLSAAQEVRRKVATVGRRCFRAHSASRSFTLSGPDQTICSCCRFVTSRSSVQRPRHRCRSNGSPRRSETATPTSSFLASIIRTLFLCRRCFFGAAHAETWSL